MQQSLPDYGVNGLVHAHGVPEVGKTPQEHGRQAREKPGAGVLDTGVEGPSVGPRASLSHGLLELIEDIDWHLATSDQWC